MVSERNLYIVKIYKYINLNIINKKEKICRKVAYPKIRRILK